MCVHTLKLHFVPGNVYDILNGFIAIYAFTTIV